MHQLIEQLFRPAFGAVDPRDAAVVEGTGKLAFTTDSYVVQPLFFPGGDIGRLAVCGTVNDLAMVGARPRFLSVGFILEEGLPVTTLCRVVQSIAAAAAAANVRIVTGDTKVVDRGKGDGLFVNTAGIGVVEHGLAIGPEAIAVGDVMLLNGDLGRHGLAVMLAREGIALESEIASDVAPLAELVLALLDAGLEVKMLRDLTRGGLASALNEIATAANLRLELDEAAIPVREDVRGACEILGFDPLYIANEGKFVAFVPPQQADTALQVLRSHPSGLGAEAVAIGRAIGRGVAEVTARSTLGIPRLIDMLSGEQLPRIC